MNLLLWPERLLFRPESESKEDDVDELDRAQELTEQFNERCLAEHMRQAHQNTPVSAVRYCEDCGILILAARLEVLPDAVCCVDCQTLREA
ncbi:TraR/DksA family transcriptional regulator [Salmonella enterica]|nr:TraR/DksA family transcriptional regulator [Salmonella enterica]ECY2753447.1 TraR/DksA family transcriptional regulator [Salmonella enterica]EEH4754397.1 TraR/DksA family transcriptional regulator [Salmonella enterica]EFP6146350.1 TraR/DksA family transcriptional regulator [Salmonella enterica]EGN0318279.1 TraR/DksA family transcriptional regulator [Salmonella enterica]